MSWTDKYQVVGIVPGRVVTKTKGEVDLSDKTLPVSLLDEIFASGCSYLQLKKLPKVAAKPIDEMPS